MEGLKRVLDMVKEDAAKIDMNKRIKELGPIYRAVVDRDLTVLEELLRHGGDPDEEDNTPYGFTAAHWAAMVSNVDVLQLLDKFETNMSAVEETDMTPLHVAALAGNCDTITWLVENTYDIESKEEHEQTPLHQAALNGRLEAARILLNHGASIDPVDMFGMTPICLALVRGFTDVVNFLLEHKANPGVRDANNKTLLHAAAANDDTFAISLILEKGINVNTIDDSNCTPLHDAAKNGSSRSVSLLLGNGAYVDAKDCQGHTPLFMATGAGHMDCVRLLLQCKYFQAPVPEDMQDNLAPVKDVDCFKMEVDCAIAKCFSHIKEAARQGNTSSNKPIHLVDNSAELDDKHCMGLPSSLLPERFNHMEGEILLPTSVTVKQECGLTDPPPKEGDHRMDADCAIAQDNGCLTVFSSQVQDAAIHTEVCTSSICDEADVCQNQESYWSSENDGCTPTVDLTFDDIEKILF